MKKVMNLRTRSVAAVAVEHGTEMLDAISRGDMKVFREIAEKHLKTDARIKEFCESDVKHKNTHSIVCPLILASKLRAPYILRYMLEHGADVNFKYSRGGGGRDIVTPLHLAVDLSHYDVVNVLLDLNASCNIYDRNHETPLLIAAQKADWGRHDTDTCARKGIRCYKICHKTKKSTIFFEGMLDETRLPRVMAQMLLSKGADPNSMDRHHNTSLHIAAKLGHLQLTRVLIHAHADVNLKGRDGAIPVQIAAREGHVHLIELFCSVEGTSINTNLQCFEDGRQKASLHLAAGQGHEEAVLVLCDRFGADVNLKDNLWNTPLHYVVLQPYRSRSMRDRKHFTNTARILLERRANPNLRNAYGDTALHLAAVNQFPKIVELLIQYDARPDAENAEHLKPVDIVPSWDHITRQLLQTAIKHCKSQKRTDEMVEVANMYYVPKSTSSAVPTIVVPAATVSPTLAAPITNLAGQSAAVAPLIVSSQINHPNTLQALDTTDHLYEGVSARYDNPVDQNIQRYLEREEEQRLQELERIYELRKEYDQRLEPGQRRLHSRAQSLENFSRGRHRGSRSLLSYDPEPNHHESGHNRKNSHEIVDRLHRYDDVKRYEQNNTSDYSMSSDTAITSNKLNDVYQNGYPENNVYSNERKYAYVIREEANRNRKLSTNSKSSRSHDRKYSEPSLVKGPACDSIDQHLYYGDNYHANYDGRSNKTNYTRPTTGVDIVRTRQQSSTPLSYRNQEFPSALTRITADVSDGSIWSDSSPEPDNYRSDREMKSQKVKLDYTAPKSASQKPQDQRAQMIRNDTVINQNNVKSKSIQENGGKQQSKSFDLSRETEAAKSNRRIPPPVAPKPNLVEQNPTFNGFLSRAERDIGDVEIMQYNNEYGNCLQEIQPYKAKKSKSRKTRTYSEGNPVSKGSIDINNGSMHINVQIDPNQENTGELVEQIKHEISQRLQSQYSSSRSMEDLTQNHTTSAVVKPKKSESSRTAKQKRKKMADENKNKKKNHRYRDLYPETADDIDESYSEDNYESFYSRDFESSDSITRNYLCTDFN